MYSHCREYYAVALLQYRLFAAFITLCILVMFDGKTKLTLFVNRHCMDQHGISVVLCSLISTLLLLTTDSVLVAELHFTEYLDFADAAEVARCVVPLQEPAEMTALLTLSHRFTSR